MTEVYDERYAEVRNKVRYDFDCGDAFKDTDDLTSLVSPEEYVFMLDDIVMYFEDLYGGTISIYPNAQDFEYIRQWFGTVADLSHEIWNWMTISTTPEKPKSRLVLAGKPRSFELTITKDIIMRLENYAD